MFGVLVRSVLLALFISSVVSPHARASASSGADIKGVGGGWVGFVPATSAKLAQFSFSAHTGPNGDFGQAQFSITDETGAPLDLWADVDCVNVFTLAPLRGGAWFSGLVTKINDPTGFYETFLGTTKGSRVYFSIFDGGDPNGVTPVDDFEPWANPPFNNLPPDVSCRDLLPFDEAPNVTHGNIVVNAN